MQKGLGRVQFRTYQQIARLFAGLELVEPGLVPIPDWRPELATLPARRSHPVLQLACAGVARKPLSQTAVVIPAEQPQSGTRVSGARNASTAATPSTAPDKAKAAANDSASTRNPTATGPVTAPTSPAIW